jgi:Zn-dependent alcohol dehydrogenase
LQIVDTGICETDAHIDNQGLRPRFPVILRPRGAGVVEPAASAVDDVVPEEPHLRNHHSGFETDQS